MWSINSSVAFTLISLTGLGVVFYVVIVIAGVSSYACPFQTPTSVALRGLWKKSRRWIFSLTVHYTRVLSWVRRTWNRGIRSLFRRQSLPTAIPLKGIEVHQSEPRTTSKRFHIIRRTNTNDIRCVSWILINITDPEALDAAIRLAGTIRWFDDGIIVDPPYDLIVSTFRACFDPIGRVYPGSRDRAYYSGRAIVWIYTLAMCKSREFARTFSLPCAGHYPASDPDPDLKHNPDPDLEHLLSVTWESSCVRTRIRCLLAINPEHTPSHSQWISNVLLHLVWANRTRLDCEFLRGYVPEHKTKALPLNAMLNRLLVWWIFLGSPVGEEAFEIQDKSYDISSSPPPHIVDSTLYQ